MGMIGIKYGETIEDITIRGEERTRDAKIVQLDYEAEPGNMRNAPIYGDAGNDSVPLNEDRIVVVKLPGTERYGMVGALVESQGAKAGEKILFAREPEKGKVVATISMLGDGKINIEAKGAAVITGDNITMQSGDTQVVLSGGKCVIKNGSQDLFTILSTFMDNVINMQTMGGPAAQAVAPPSQALFNLDKQALAALLDGSSAGSSGDEENDEGADGEGGEEFPENAGGPLPELPPPDAGGSLLPAAWVYGLATANATTYFKRSRVGDPSDDSWAPQEVLVRDPHAGMDMLFRRETGLVTRPDGSRPRSHAYTWVYHNVDIHLYDIGDDYAWRLARNSGRTIMEVLARVRPVVWRFLRDICAFHTGIRQIIITGLWRPDGVPHSTGLGLDIGKIIFWRNTVIAYSRDEGNGRFTTGIADVPADYRAIHLTFRDWIWGLGLEYVNQYIDPWYVRNVSGLGYSNINSWNDNRIRWGYPAANSQLPDGVLHNDQNLKIQETEWGHKDHLHITFKED